MKNKLSIIILAAGKGTRMNSDLPKVLHKVKNKSMIEHVIYQSENLYPDKSIIVVGYKHELVRDHLKKINLTFAMQEVQKGTAHAVMQCYDLLKDFNGSTLILSGDVPLIKSKTLKDLYKIHLTNNCRATLLSAKVNNPFGYGRIIRGDKNNFKAIIEEKDATDNQKSINEINAGIYIFDNQTLFENINKIKNDNNQSEYYLPDILEIMIKQNFKIMVHQIEDENQIKGANTENQLLELEKYAK